MAHNTISFEKKNVLCIDNNFSVAQHVQRLVNASAQMVYALRVLRTHGLGDDVLQHIYMVASICHLIFFCHNTLFFFLILCCGKFVTTHYFLSHNTLFFQKNIVLRTWRTTQYLLKKERVVTQKNKVADTCHHTFIVPPSSPD